MHMYRRLAACPSCMQEHGRQSIKGNFLLGVVVRVREVIQAHWLTRGLELHDVQSKRGNCPLCLFLVIIIIFFHVLAQKEMPAV